jgi:hypothetical protein
MNGRRPAAAFLNLLCAAVVCLGLLAHPGTTEGITPDGARLLRALDQTRVEDLWRAGVHIAWETGEPDGRPERTQGKHTHCSAFAAAIAKRLGIYLLRPPEHGQVLLANAQSDWLSGQGPAHGWEEAPGADQAQASANRGCLVVAVYHNPRDNRPGHIAIVRPSSRSGRDLQLDGPQITQAGARNYLSTTLRQGFAGHPGAWSRREVRYFAHGIDWNRIQGRE